MVSSATDGRHFPSRPTADLECRFSRRAAGRGRGGRVVLPTFLGIGVDRAGTTWLHELLARHPQVYVPRRRKEIHFFDRSYQRGLGWYERFFPRTAEASHYQAIGEITPSYFHHPQCAERIASVPSIGKLLLMLRNPADRAYSHYLFRARIDHYLGTFDQFLACRPQALEHGFYSRRLKVYLRHFRREQILVLIYERAFADVNATKEAVARFLGVEPGGFPAGAGNERVNKAFVPRVAVLYAVASRIGRQCHRWDLDWVVNAAKWLGAKRLFREGAQPPRLDPEKRRQLLDRYRADMAELAPLLEMDLSCWQ